ncbi:cysteine hydrolase [Geomonas terrae]|uniref:Cysteine hydrolase n=1 Tax=Geomonas terrae TaxID=2562681 RepID=A0A4V3NZQ6_9BACT|nr:cysteine hydrolase family protein [Geomonas terrae]TGU72642.1 cysteine hydrolase [Geomonas terrae]
MCLIIIDIQNDYFAGGTMELVGMPEAAANARLLLDAYCAAGLPVIHVQHLAARPDATFFIPGTPGAEINQIAAPIASEPVVVKHFPNSFRETGLLDLLKSKQITNLTICGAMSHMCIDTTVRAAFDLGFTCTLAADACATRDLTFEGHIVPAADVHAAYMSALSLVFARVTATATVIEELKRP